MLRNINIGILVVTHAKVLVRGFTAAACSTQTQPAECGFSASLCTQALPFSTLRSLRPSIAAVNRLFIERLETNSSQ